RAALSIRMDAPISLKPSESEMKSLISAIDNALRLEPCGAEAFGAPSKKNSTGTCRIWEICCNRLAGDAGGASLVFLHLLEAETEGGNQVFLAHCKQNTAHPHPAADVPVGGVRGLLSRQW